MSLFLLLKMTHSTSINTPLAKLADYISQHLFIHILVIYKYIYLYTHMYIHHTCMLSLSDMPDSLRSHDPMGSHWACQAPLCMELSRKKNETGCHFTPQGPTTYWVMIIKNLLKLANQSDSLMVRILPTQEFLQRDAENRTTLTCVFLIHIFKYL